MKHHQQQWRRGNGLAQDTQLTLCPDCRGPLMVPTENLTLGARMQCSHCGQDLYLTTLNTPAGDHYWTLVSEEYYS